MGEWKIRIWEWTKWEGYALYEKYARRDRNRNLNLHGERESSTTNYFQTNVAGKRKFKFSILFSQQGWNEAHRTTRRETRRGLTRFHASFFKKSISRSIRLTELTILLSRNTLAVIVTHRTVNAMKMHSAFRGANSREISRTICRIA